MPVPANSNHIGLVALLAEGVDRNAVSQCYNVCVSWSPSSRRAWIEIFRAWDMVRSEFVALLAEGVDRNPEQA